MMKSLLFGGLMVGLLGLGQASMAHESIDPAFETKVRSDLAQAGLTAPIHQITPSPIDGIYELEVGNGASLLISADGSRLMAGPLEANPSPVVAIDPSLYQNQTLGAPITAAHKQALLANMTALPKVTPDTAFFYSGMHQLIWGIQGVGQSPFLVSADGRYLLGGDVNTLIDGHFSQEDTAFTWAKNRHVLTALDERDLAIYPAKGKERAVVYVATDIHCPYCKLFHAKISDYNARGITIKAIGFPVYDESPAIMNSIWCEADPNKRAPLLSAAMKGLRPTANACTSRLAATQKQASALDILATPAIFNAQGQLFVGDFTTEEFYQFLGL